MKDNIKLLLFSLYIIIIFIYFIILSNERIDIKEKSKEENIEEENYQDDKEYNIKEEQKNIKISLNNKTYVDEDFEYIKEIFKKMKKYNKKNKEMMKEIKVILNRKIKKDNNITKDLEIINKKYNLLFFLKYKKLISFINENKYNISKKNKEKDKKLNFSKYNKNNEKNIINNEKMKIKNFLKYIDKSNLSNNEKMKIKNFLNICNSIKKRVKILIKNMEKLSQRYPGLYYPNIIESYKKAQKIIQKGEILLEKIKNSIEDGKDKNIKKYINEIEKYKNEELLNKNFLKNIKDAEKKLKESNELIKSQEKREKNKRKKGQRAIEEKLMGKWYFQLKILAKKIKENLNKHFRVENKGAAIRITFIQNNVRKILNYPSDIYEIYQTLQSALNKGKDVNKWIEKQKRKITSISKANQLKILKNFVESNKFNMEIENIQNLEKGVEELESDIDKGILKENTARNILKILQKINREYEEKRKNFYSSVLNFLYN